jgi:hypothetical protein
MIKNMSAFLSEIFAVSFGINFFTGKPTGSNSIKLSARAVRLSDGTPKPVK